MENRGTSEAPIEELLEKLDISKCTNESGEAIILSKLLSLLYLNYNIPTDSTPAPMQTRRSTSSPTRARSS